MDADRRDIERALHDGVQQDLVALSIRLQLARRLLTDDPVEGLRLIDEAERDVHDALTRLRELADRIYPSLLDPFGLPEALRATGLDVEAGEIGRFPAAVEAAAFFFCRDLAGTRARISRTGDALAIELEGSARASASARAHLEAVGGSIVGEQAGYVSAVIPDGGRSAR